MSRVQDIPFALPIAGDALMLFYRPASAGGNPPQNWQEVLAFGNPLLFAGDDPQAMVTLTLYRSLGGLVQDLQGRPALQPDLLQKVFDLYQEGARRGTFPPAVTQYQSGGQVWQAYLDGQADWVVTFASFYLTDRPTDTAALLLPSLGGDDFTQATGWGLAIADPDPQRRPLAVALAEYLSEADFLAEWAVAAGYLPVHPTSLGGWQPVTLQSTLSRVVLSAQIRPSNEILASLGPVLREGTLTVLRNQASPAQAAQSAAEKLLAP
jgi:ABC-type glycerol-3-phosphate transport system substrate-binding protein